MKTVILDTETTGFDDPIRPVEVGYIELVNLTTMELGSRFNQRYNPDRNISWGAMSTHNIIQEDILDKPLYTEFVLPKDVEYVIGHNVQFDCDVLNISNDVKQIDTLNISRRLFPLTPNYESYRKLGFSEQFIELKKESFQSNGYTLDSHKLTALMYMLAKDKNKVRERLKNAHSAIDDCLFCAFLLLKIIKIKNFNSIEELYEFSEQCKIPTTMFFGKYKGIDIADIPNDYISWMFNNMSELDQNLKKALEIKLSTQEER